MIHCTKCNKQYIGETKLLLKDSYRFDEHRRHFNRVSYITYKLRDLL